jgi:hypothetical protein
MRRHVKPRPDEMIQSSESEGSTPQVLEPNLNLTKTEGHHGN